MLIHLCVNEPDNGNCTNKLDAIQFGDLLKLESAFWPDPDVTFRRLERSRIRIGRRTFPVLSYATWVGNWCWDAVEVDAQTFIEIFNHIQGLRFHGMQKFQPDSGITKLWNIYKSGQPLKYFGRTG